MKWDTFLRLRLFIRLDINLVEKKGAIDRKKKKKLTTCLFLLDFSFNEIYENAFYISLSLIGAEILYLDLTFQPEYFCLSVLITDP